MYLTEIEEYIEKYKKIFTLSKSYKKFTSVSLDNDLTDDSWRKRFAEYYKIALEKLDDSEISDNLAELYCLMTFMKYDVDNYLSGGNKRRTPTKTPKSIVDLKKYNEKIFCAIEALPEEFSSYIKNQPCYTYNQYITNYFDIIMQRLSILTQAIMRVKVTNLDNLDDVFSNMISKLDFTIEEFFNIQINAAKAKKQYSIENDPPIYFDKFFSELFSNFNKIDFKAKIEEGNRDLFQYDKQEIADKIAGLERKNTLFYRAIKPEAIEMNKNSKFEIEKIMEHICCLLDEDLEKPKYLQECLPSIYKAKYGNSDDSYKKALSEYKNSLNPSESLKYKEIEAHKGYFKRNIKERYNDLVYGGLYLTNDYLLKLEYKRSEIQKYLIKKLKNYYDKDNQKFLYYKIPKKILNKKISDNIKFTIYDIVYLYAATFYDIYTDEDSKLFDKSWRHIIESFLLFSILEKIFKGFEEMLNSPEINKNYIDSCEHLLICVLNILECGTIRSIYQKYPIDIDYTLEDDFELTLSDNFEEDIYNNLYKFEQEKTYHKILFDYYESDFSAYAYKIIKKSLKNPNCHKICKDIYECANHFIKEIFWNDDTTRINLYKEYREKSDKHKYLLEGIIGEVLYENAITEMGLKNSLNKNDEKDNLKDKFENSKKSVENFADEITFLVSLKIENNKLSLQQIEQILKTFAEKQGIGAPSKYSISKFIENI